MNFGIYFLFASVSATHLYGMVGTIKKNGAATFDLALIDTKTGAYSTVVKAGFAPDPTRTTTTQANDLACYNPETGIYYWADNTQPLGVHPSIFSVSTTNKTVLPPFSVKTIEILQFFCTNSSVWILTADNPDYWLTEYDSGWNQLRSFKPPVNVQGAFGVSGDRLYYLSNNRSSSSTTAPSPHVYTLNAQTGETEAVVVLNCPLDQVWNIASVPGGFVRGAGLILIGTFGGHYVAYQADLATGACAVELVEKWAQGSYQTSTYDPATQSLYWDGLSGADNVLKTYSYASNSTTVAPTSIEWFLNLAASSSA